MHIKKIHEIMEVLVNIQQKSKFNQNYKQKSLFSM